MAALCGVLWPLGDARAAQLTFQWDHNDPRAMGFVLHCGPAIDNYDLHVDVGNTRIATVNGLAAGTTYRCAATAYSANEQSGYSNDIPATTPAPPNPAFGMSATSGAAPLSVAFTNTTDTTIGPVTRWEWDFGDGAGSTLPTPTHVYATPGRYTVVLTAHGPGGSVSRTSSVSVAVGGGNSIIGAVRAAVATVVEGPPATNFSFARASGSGPLTAPVSVKFTNESTGATAWRWNFGDGNTSAEQSPTYTYYFPGTYNVVLTAMGPGGTGSMTATTTITVLASTTGSQAASQSLNVPSTANTTTEPDCSNESPRATVLGDDVLGTPDAGQEGVAVAFSTAAVECGNVASLSVYLDAKSSASKLVVGLYSDHDGHPGTLLAQGTMLNPVAGAWNSVPVAPKRVVKGAVYWIAILGGQGGSVYYHTRAGSCAAETSAQTGLLSLPSAWFTGSIVGACPVAAYGTSIP